jgi:hypothetical protein
VKNSKITVEVSTPPRLPAVIRLQIPFRSRPAGLGIVAARLRKKAASKPRADRPHVHGAAESQAKAPQGRIGAFPRWRNLHRGDFPSSVAGNGNGKSLHPKLTRARPISPSKSSQIRSFSGILPAFNLLFVRCKLPQNKRFHSAIQVFVYARVRIAK